MQVTRRQVLGWTGAGMAAAMGVTPQAKGRKIGLGVQLYSVRDVKDFDVMLKGIADMGFEGVEFAGYGKYGGDAEGLKKKLDELKLKAVGTHIGLDKFSGDNFKKTVEFHKTIGCKYLIVPGDGRFSHPEKSKEYAEGMKKAAEALKAEGMFCGHHNHTAEFKKEGDKTYWDLFVERTAPDVVIEQDIGWTRAAGLDPVELLKKAQGRTKLTHIKAMPEKGKGKAIIGEDEYDWKRVLTACYEIGGTEWFLVEQEAYPDKKSSMECTEMSLKGLKKILSDMGK